MHIGRIAHCLLIVACLPTASSMAQGVAADGPSSTVRVSVNHFGTMGEFVRPGVYSVSSATPSVQEVVKLAGGLSPNASGNLKIIRNGHANQRLYYSPTLNVSLLPGDIVVADSRNGNRSQVRTIEYGKSQPSTSSTPANAIQIALVDLVDRPVVSYVSREKATLAGVLELLGQSPSLVDSVHLIRPGVAAMHHTGENDLDEKLLSTTTIVFDRIKVNREALPNLPPIINSAVEAEKSSVEVAPKPFRPAPNIPGETNSSRPLPSNVIIIPRRENRAGERTTRPNAAEQVGPFETNPGSPTFIRPTSDEQGAALHGPSLSSPPPITVAPIFPVDQSTPGSREGIDYSSDMPAHRIPIDTTGHAETADATTEQTNAVSDRPKLIDTMSNAGSQPIIEPVKALKEPESKPESNSADAWIAVITPAKLLGIIVTAAMLTLIAVTFRNMKRLQALERAQGFSRTMAADTAIPAGMTSARQQRQRLDELINGKMRLIEESPNFPATLALFGNPAEQPRIRLDEPQAISQPHFARKRQQAPAARSTATVSASIQPITAKRQMNSQQYDIVAPDETMQSGKKDLPGALRDIQPKGAAGRRQNEALSLLDRILTDMHKEPRT